MKAIIHLSLDEDQQDKELKVLEGKKTHTLHAEAGQAVVSIPAGHMLAVVPIEKPAPKKKAAAPAA